jgi:hypothetical protein
MVNAYRRIQLKGKSKMCHCNDNLALRPMVAKVLKRKK